MIKSTLEDLKRLKEIYKDLSEILELPLNEVLLLVVSRELIIQNDLLKVKKAKL